jgi:mannose-6-phosphate isomerase-like protein (cupin superfamily)
MKFLPIAFAAMHFASIPPTVESGARGESISRVRGDLRMRVVEYDAGYVADHWCDRGHAFFVLRGTIDVELRDGRTFSLGPNMSFAVFR